MTGTPVEMTAVKVSEIDGPALDWLVARCAIAKGGLPVYMRFYTDGRPDVPHWGESGSSEVFRPTSRGDHAMPFIDQADIDVYRAESGSGGLEYLQYGARLARAKLKPDGRASWYAPARGATRLIAAIRCYVKAEVGEEVEVPAYFVRARGEACSETVRERMRS